MSLAHTFLLFSEQSYVLMEILAWASFTLAPLNTHRGVDVAARVRMHGWPCPPGSPQRWLTASPSRAARLGHRRQCLYSTVTRGGEPLARQDMPEASRVSIL